MAEPLSLAAALAAATLAPVAPAPVQASVNPRAVELFEGDWALMHWAMKRFDADGDGRLSLAEAQPAAEAFRTIADGDGNGRVTPYEYQRARDFIIARY